MWSTTTEQLQRTARDIYIHMQPSAQIAWPLLAERAGFDIRVKHENHNPTGAFKVRGGLVFISRLLAGEPRIAGIVTATRGNHGQSIAYAAARHGLRTVVVVPRGNSPDKNRAMAAYGAELVVHGDDFDEAVEHSIELAAAQNLYRIPSFHPDLVEGVATYSLEFLQAMPELQRLYIPIGLGSGICGAAMARNALRHQVELVGVVAARADAYVRSFEAGRVIPTKSADTFADGMAVRVPNEDALRIIRDNVTRIVSLQEQEIADAVRIYFDDTHNVAEGAGAAALAAALKERELNKGDTVGVSLCGGNISGELFREILAGNFPAPPQRRAGQPR